MDYTALYSVTIDVGNSMQIQIFSQRTLVNVRNIVETVSGV